MIDKEKEAILLRQLRSELTESIVYQRLAEMEKNPINREVLARISADEAAHGGMISGILGRTARPLTFKAAWIVACARVFGLTFVLKLMERGENAAGNSYRKMIASYPQLEVIARDEERHENELVGMLHDDRLKNMGSIVLGLNDALVELTGALAGFTFALADSCKIMKLGFITGLAAAMSMAASAFLSARADAEAGNADAEDSSEGRPSALKSALYTGVAYVVTVFLLVAPYAVFPNPTHAMVVMLFMALGIIAFFNFYLSVARETSFRRGFLLMAGISTLVALISYGFGYLLR